MRDKEKFAKIVLLKQGKKQREHEAILEEDFSKDWDSLAWGKPQDMDVWEEQKHRDENNGSARSFEEPKQRWRRPVSRKALEQRFTEVYKAYILPTEPRSSYRDRFMLEDLLRLLAELCTYVIYDRIRTLTVYCSGDEEVITQQGHEDACEKLLEDRRNGQIRSGALYYFVSIYKYKTVDYLRYYGLWKPREEQDENGDPLEKRRLSGVRKSDLLNTTSIERMATNEKGEVMLDRFEKLSVNPFLEDGKIRSAGSRNLMMIYLRELLDYRKKPAGPLAVVYARILYQLERNDDGELIDELVDAYMAKRGWKNDPADERFDEHLVLATEEVQRYTTSTNLKWAVKRMGEKTIKDLMDDSEESLREHFSTDLAWSDAARWNLGQAAFVDSETTWGELVYTREFSQKRMERWSTDVHNATIKRAAPIIRRDKKMLDFVLEELDDSNQLKKEVQKQIGKEVGRR